MRLGIVTVLLRSAGGEEQACSKPWSNFDAQAALAVRETAAKGLGVFAETDIPAGTCLGEYGGKRVKIDAASPLLNEFRFACLWYYALLCQHEFIRSQCASSGAPAFHRAFSKIL